MLKFFLAAGDRDVPAILGELRRLELSRSLDDTQKMKVLLEGLIDVETPKAVAPQYTKHAGLLSQVGCTKAHTISRNVLRV